jgi:hypothetical protein
VSEFVMLAKKHRQPRVARILFAGHDGVMVGIGAAFTRSPDIQPAEEGGLNAGPRLFFGGLV